MHAQRRRERSLSGGGRPPSLPIMAASLLIFLSITVGFAAASADATTTTTGSGTPKAAVDATKSPTVPPGDVAPTPATSTPPTAPTPHPGTAIATPPANEPTEAEQRTPPPSPPKAHQAANHHQQPLASSSTITATPPPPAPAPPSPPVDARAIMTTNYASAYLGAKVVEAHKDSKHASSLLKDNKESYINIPCKAERKFFTVQLSREIEVNLVAISNLEFFSSFVKNFTLLGSRVYPCHPPNCMWRVLGNFQGKPVRQNQLFPIARQPSIRFLRFLWVSHHGTEKSCTMTSIQVYGTDVLESFAADLGGANTVGGSTIGGGGRMGTNFPTFAPTIVNGGAADYHNANNPSALPFEGPSLSSMDLDSLLEALVGGSSGGHGTQHKTTTSSGQPKHATASKDGKNATRATTNATNTTTNASSADDPPVGRFVPLNMTAVSLVVEALQRNATDHNGTGVNTTGNTMANGTSAECVCANETGTSSTVGEPKGDVTGPSPAEQNEAPNDSNLTIITRADPEVVNTSSSPHSANTTAAEKDCTCAGSNGTAHPAAANATPTTATPTTTTPSIIALRHKAILSLIPENATIRPRVLRGGEQDGSWGVSWDRYDSHANNKKGSGGAHARSNKASHPDHRADYTLCVDPLTNLKDRSSSDSSTALVKCGEEAGKSTGSNAMANANKAQEEAKCSNGTSSNARASASPNGTKPSTANCPSNRTPSTNTTSSRTIVVTVIPFEVYMRRKGREAEEAHRHGGDHSRMLMLGGGSGGTAHHHDHYDITQTPTYILQQLLYWDAVKDNITRISGSTVLSAFCVGAERPREEYYLFGPGAQTPIEWGYTVPEKQPAVVVDAAIVQPASNGTDKAGGENATATAAGNAPSATGGGSSKETSADPSSPNAPAAATPPNPPPLLPHQNAPANPNAGYYPNTPGPTNTVNHHHHPHPAVTYHQQQQLQQHATTTTQLIIRLLQEIKGLQYTVALLRDHNETATAHMKALFDEVKALHHSTQRDAGLVQGFLEARIQQLSHDYATRMNELEIRMNDQQTLSGHHFVFGVVWTVVASVFGIVALLCVALKPNSAAVVGSAGSRSSRAANNTQQPSAVSNPPSTPASQQQQPSTATPSDGSSANPTFSSLTSRTDQPSPKSAAASPTSRGPTAAAAQQQMMRDGGLDATAAFVTCPHTPTAADDSHSRGEGGGTALQGDCDQPPLLLPASPIGEIDSPIAIMSDGPGPITPTAAGYDHHQRPHHGGGAVGEVMSNVSQLHTLRSTETMAPSHRHEDGTSGDVGGHHHDNGTVIVLNGSFSQQTQQHNPNNGITNGDCEEEYHFDHTADDNHPLIQQPLATARPSTSASAAAALLSEEIGGELLTSEPASVDHYDGQHHGGGVARSHSNGDPSHSHDPLGAGIGTGGLPTATTRAYLHDHGGQRQQYSDHRAAAASAATDEEEALRQGHHQQMQLGVGIPPLHPNTISSNKAIPNNSSNNQSCMAVVVEQDIHTATPPTTANSDDPTTNSNSNTQGGLGLMMMGCSETDDDGTYRRMLGEMTDDCRASAKDLTDLLNGV